MTQDLHAAIMNLPCKPYDGTDLYSAYCRGHRDARHAAAELALSAAPAPQARELTDAEIADCIPDDSEEQFANDPAGFIRNFARAVLAARGAKKESSAG